MKNGNSIIKKDYLKKIDLLDKYDEAYYLNSSPLVNDSEYDQLKNQIFTLEKKYKFLKNKKSPSLKVGYKPSKTFKKIKHKVPMLSLNNAFNKDAVNMRSELSNKRDRDFNSRNPGVTIFWL